MKQRGFIQFLVLILILAAVGLGAFYFGKSQKQPSQPPSQTPPATQTEKTVGSCTKDGDCSLGYFCDYGFNCREAPIGPGCTKIYSGSQKCVKECDKADATSGCPNGKKCQVYFVPSGSDVVLQKLGCK